MGESNIVYSLHEARDWFCQHSQGSVVCVRNDAPAEQACASYPEAKAFYNADVEELP